MITRRSVLGAALALPFATVSTASFGQAKKYRIAFGNYSDEAVFGATVLQGVKDAAAKRSDVEVLYFDNRQDPAKAIENARTIVSSKADAVVWYTTMPDVNKRAATLFEEAKIPGVAVQAPTPGLPLFAVDNALSGEQSGKAAAIEFHKRFGTAKAEVLLLGWPENGPLFIERTAAAKKAIEQELPDAHFEEFSTTGDPNRARQLTADFLTRRPDAKAIIWAHVDAMGIAALAATRNAGREADLVISTTGGDKSVLPEIRKAGGPFIGTFSFFPNLWGGDLLDAAVEAAQGKKLPDHISPKRQVFVDISNINEFYPQ